VCGIDKAVSQNPSEFKIFGQIGKTTYQPKHFKAVSTLDKPEFDKILTESSAVIGHAGIGTIKLALDFNKPLLVMPRLAKYGEVVNDHQVGIAQKFAESGWLLTADDEGLLLLKLRELRTFIPKQKINQADRVAAQIKKYLDQILN
jgi:UDP-N-acetylglucosamine transferase subunit ALG13